MQQTFNEINENDTLVAISYAKQMSEDYTKAVYLQKQKEKERTFYRNLIRQYLLKLLRKLKNKKQKLI